MLFITKKNQNMLANLFLFTCIQWCILNIYDIYDIIRCRNIFMSYSDGFLYLTMAGLLLSIILNAYICFIQKGKVMFMINLSNFLNICFSILGDYFTIVLAITSSRLTLLMSPWKSVEKKYLYFELFIKPFSYLRKQA